MKLSIGLSYAPQDSPKYQKYREAIEKASEASGNEVDVVNLYENPNRIQDVDGIVFTGGADVAPERYGKQNEAHLCTEIDESRDRIEFELAARSEELELPILGICRGAQLLNIYRGGTLITDLEHFGGANHKKVDPSTDSRHLVKVDPTSMLKKILRESEGEINSAHHQAIERLGADLQISARALSDGTVEAIEWADPKGRPFFLAVQWHPERMEYSERFSHPLFESFVWEVAAHKLLRSRMGSLKESRERSERQEEQQG